MSAADLTVAESGPWTLGTLIWLPSLLIILIALFILGRWLWSHREDNYDGKAARILAVYIVPIIALCFIVGTAIGMYPYKAEYHQWRDVSGTVVSIDSRLIGNSSGSPETKFVVVIDGRQFGCDDTRCAAIEPGDHIELSCKRAWQYTGTDGYDCRFVSSEDGAA